MEKLNEKRALEAEQEKVVRKKAQNDMLDWASQRDVRLNAKKVKKMTIFHFTVPGPPNSF